MVRLGVDSGKTAGAREGIGGTNRYVGIGAGGDEAGRFP